MIKYFIKSRMDKANKNEFEYEILNGDFSEFESYISFKIILVGTPQKE